MDQEQRKDTTAYFDGELILEREKMGKTAFSLWKKD